MYLKFRKHRGFTIIEVLISLAIFSIIVIPISMMVLHSVKINKQSEEKQQSMIIVQNLLENIKSLSDEEFINESSLKISTEGDLNIIREKNSYNFNISGLIKGYIIEGYIKPSNKYEFNTNNSDIKKNINIYISENPNVVLNVQDKNGQKKETIYLNNKEINLIKKDEKKLKINETNIGYSNNIDNIGILFDKTCREEYKLLIKNNSDKESDIYIFRKESSSSSCDIKNIGGVFNVYSNIVIPDEEYSSNNRLYEIYVKAKKGKDFFESYSYKNIN